MLSVKNFYKNTNSFLSILILTISISFSFNNTVSAQVAGAQFDSHPMHWARYWARAVFDRNLIYSTIWNIGNINGVRWPGTEGLGYLGSAHFFVGSYVTDMTAYKSKVIPEDWEKEEYSKISIISNAYLPHVSTSTVAQLSSDRTHQQIWQPFPGYYNDGFYGYIWGINEDVNRDGELDPSEDVNFNGQLDYNLDPPLSILKSMAISTDKRTWPEYWPGGSYIGDDRPIAGRPPKTSNAGARAGQWNGEYKAGPIADQETLYMMDDHENDFWNDYKVENYWPMKNPDGTPDTTEWGDPDPNKLAIAGAGVEVESRTYGWFHPLAEDLLVSVYRVRNYSDHDLNRVVTGMWADPNIVHGNFNAADFIIADFVEGEGRLEFDILYVWHKFPDQLNTFQKVGTFGFGFLESPGIEYNGVDDDKDGIVDESMSDGIDNDGDWRPFEDIGIEDIAGTRGNGKWDTEDINLNGGLDSGEDVNKNDKLDYEPINDDRGTDGIGPDENGWPGPDPDGTETDGSYQIGEPNFDVTDIDEADQAGLENVFVYETNKVLRDQKGFWDKYISKPGQNIEETDENIVFLFGAKDVRLETIDNLQQAEKPTWKRFTITLLMGEDEDDLIRNKATMQSIYNNNYRFLTPPLQPTLIANVSSKKVQLYWDSDAEYSKDPFFGEDFNGYRLYKSTDPDFLDVKTVTDAFGNVLLFEPLEIFDYNDDLKGAHPIPFPNLGVHYDMGKNSGLKHSYVDTLVENGRTYYYAVSSIDAGNDWDFYERGLVSVDYPLAAMPSESPFNITVNELGEVVFRDRNTAVCVPQESAAGYTEPFIDSSKIDHVSGFARGGKFNIDVYNKHHATDHLGEIYELTFKDDQWLDSLTPDYQWGSTRGITCINKTTGDTLFDQSYENTYDYLRSAPIEVERGIYEGLNFDLSFPIDTNPDHNKGISIIKYNGNGRATNDWKKWSTDTESNLRVEDIALIGAGKPLPRDFELRVEDHIVDRSYAPAPMPPLPQTVFEYDLNFAVWDVTDPNNQKKMTVTVVYDKNKNAKLYPEEMFGQVWDSTRVLIRFPQNPTHEKYNVRDPYWSSWELRFKKNVFDSLSATIPPAPGDVFKIRTERNPIRVDTFRFKADGGEWLASDVQTEGRKKVYVVPDPYVGANTLESIYELAGNSQRRVDFVNLPPKCTIYIFTAAGALVKKLEHEGKFDEGREPWDLTAEDGPEVAFGMYFFVMEAEGLETQRGKFAIIK
ncbi:MAG: hypothetical protein ABFS12_09880 [Bacteroidota bacterium]